MAGFRLTVVDTGPLSPDKNKLVSRIRSSYPHWAWTVMVWRQNRSIEAKVCFGPVSGPRGYPARCFDRDDTVTRSRLG